MAGRRVAAVTLCVAIGVGLHGSASAQSLTVGDPVEDYLRLLQISGAAQLGSFSVRPLPPRDYAASIPDAGHPWSDRLEPRTAGEGGPRLVVDPPVLRSFANSRFPLGQNDGVVWQGRGLTTALDGGATVSWGPLTASLRPTLLYTRNSDIDLAPAPTLYDYPWRPIDLPQQFGPDPFWTLDPGQSEIRLDGHGVALGFGTTNLWWGPALRNPIVMSNNAPGLAHAFLGTSGPVGIGIGELEARWIWGDLDQSDWFGYSAPREDRFVTGLVAAYAPSFLPGLTLGGTRVFYVTVPEGGTPFGDYFAVFQGVRKKSLVSPQNPTGNDEHDQLLSLFGRWVLPESGFELFWEWARNDHSWDLRDLLLEPEHSQAYMLGLQKALTLSGDRILALRFELTHLEREPTFALGRSVPTYYAHQIVTQGYTQEGQVIGAGIGPGGNGQGLGADLYAPWGRARLLLQRDVRDQDAYFQWAVDNDRGSCCHNVLYHLDVNGLFFLGDFDLGGGFIVTREFNRYFFGLDLWNLNLSFSARWRPEGLSF